MGFNRSIYIYTYIYTYTYTYIYIYDPIPLKFVGCGLNLAGNIKRTKPQMVWNTGKGQTIIKGGIGWAAFCMLHISDLS